MHFNSIMMVPVVNGKKRLFNKGTQLLNDKVIKIQWQLAAPCFCIDDSYSLVSFLRLRSIYIQISGVRVLSWHLSDETRFCLCGLYDRIHRP